MNNFDIDDKRDIKEFKGIVFSKYKKSDSKKELLKSIINNKIEQSCYWVSEFICAGHYSDIWEIILTVLSKNIHLGNPKLPIYVELRFNDFKNIIINGYVGNELKMRNNPKIRILFAEIVSIMCLSKKKLAFDNIKILKEDFNIANLSFKLKADKLNYGQRVFKKEDPKELFIGINEFAYHISKSSYNTQLACYWLEWLLGYEQICFKENKVKKIGARRQMPVLEKFQKDTIWIIWEILLYESKQKNNIIHKIINSLLNLFCLKYSQSCPKRRKNLIYFSISLITEHVDLNIKMCKNNAIVEEISKKINIVYKQIKKNEVKPDTDYLFNNSLNAGNLEKTISKLEKMNTLMNIVTRN